MPDKTALLKALQTEIQRHDFDTFVQNPPSISQGGKGVVVPGCPHCKKPIYTIPQFLDHLANDVVPKVAGLWEIKYDGYRALS